MSIEILFFVEDYFLSIFDPLFFTFIAPDTQACITIRITNDNIKEHLLKFFNITLLPYDPITSPTPGYTGLTVDTTPSSICIEDDDGKLTNYYVSHILILEQKLTLDLSNPISHFLKPMVIKISMLYWIEDKYQTIKLWRSVILKQVITC